MKKLTFLDFLQRAEKVHGKLFDYSKVQYLGKDTLVTIICKTHGEFKQTPGNHWHGQGCPKCKGSKISCIKKKTSRAILRKFVAESDTGYNYLEETFKDFNSPMTIVCPTHGEFQQTPGNHFHQKQGCPKCGIIKRSLTTEQFIARAKVKHNNKYSYDKTVYLPGKDLQKVAITCPKHGDFLQRPDMHLFSSGCPRCQSRISKGEQEVADYIKSLGAEFEQQNKTILAPAELDIWVPGKKLAIEFNGMHWHADDRARRNTARTKYEACSAKGIRLINMFDFEWHESQEAVKATLKAAFGQQTTIGARHLMIDDIYPSAARMFLSKWHVDKFAAASLYLGMFYQNKLVGVASFGKSRFGNGDYELVRYATNAHIPGGLSRCIAHAAKIIGFKKLVSYCDMRYGTGRSYASAGFKFIGLTPPDYWWFKGNVRLKRYQTQKHKLKDHPEFAEFYSKDKTEAEICEAAGWRKLSGVGHSKWELTINT